MLKKKKERKLNKKKHFLGVEPGSTHLLVCPPTTDHCSNTCSLCTRLVYNDILQPLYIKKKKKIWAPKIWRPYATSLEASALGWLCRPPPKKIGMA